MSGIAGVYNLDGRPADRALLVRMTDAIAHRGPDDGGYWTNGPIALGHRMLHTTPEALHERQPLTDETGELCLTMDGRVDNREELKAALEGRGFRLRTDTDAEIVLRAYECWGEECPGRILGDFAFAVWDGRKRQLFCARDAIGSKPFYYYTDGRIFLFGSELCQILEAPTVRREPNEGMIGEYLAVEITNLEETLYLGILRLPAAHFLILRQGHTRKQRYWDIDPGKEIRHRTDDEYAEHFLEIFKEAVRCQLRSHRPVGAYLSGGLDSSSVVGMVALLSRGGEFADLKFETFSLLFPGLACDEATYIREVVRMWGIRSNTVCSDGAQAYPFAEDVRRYLDFPGAPNGAMHDPLMGLAQKRGFGVLLSGVGGDEWFSEGSAHYPELLRSFRIREFIRRIRWESAALEPACRAPRMLRVGPWPLLLRTAQLGASWVRRRLPKEDSAPRWINPHFAKATNLLQRLRPDVPVPPFPRLAQRDLYNMATNGWRAHGAEMQDRGASSFGFEDRQPFNDRRVVEFAFALPEEQRFREGQTKFILRQASKCLLPEAVRRRRTKAEFSGTLADALQALGWEVFASLRIASQGWVDKEQVRQMYAKITRAYTNGNRGHHPHLWPLWMIFGIDLWFKNVFERPQLPAESELRSGCGLPSVARKTTAPIAACYDWSTNEEEK